MNKTLNPFLFLVLSAGVFAFATGVRGAGKLPSYDEFEAKLQIDRSPLKKTGGVVTTYADVIEKARPAVVSIFATTEVEASEMNELRNHPLFRDFFRVPEHYKQRGLGSGVILTSDGYILTNSHVVAGADEILVKLPVRQKEYDAKLIGVDKSTDIAIIKIDAKGLKTATLADSDKIRVGDIVLAIGSPFELEQSVTMGIVSALGRTNRETQVGGYGFYADFIQTDAPINPGNSGGALIDAQGRVVGINTAIQSSGMVRGNIGIGFAIPTNLTLSIVQRLFDGEGEVQRGFLGVGLAPLNADLAEALGRDDYSGAVVNEIVPDSPAATAGFEVYDLIVEYDGEKVTNDERLRFDIGNDPPGKKAVFKVIRNGKPVEVDATLGDRAEFLAAAQSDGSPRVKPAEREPDKAFMDGVEIADLNDQYRRLLSIETDVEGVVVKSVEAGSAAAEAGLSEGNVIVEVNKTAVSTVDEAVRVRKKVKGKVLLLRVFAEGRHALVAVRTD